MMDASAAAATLQRQGFVHVPAVFGPDEVLALRRQMDALFDDPALLAAKLTEEAGELAEARGAEEVCWETADLIYFALVAARRAGVGLADVEAELDRRAGRVSRRPGNAKEIQS